MPGWDAAKLDFMRSGGYNVAAQIPGVRRNRADPVGGNPPPRWGLGGPSLQPHPAASCQGTHSFMGSGGERKTPRNRQVVQTLQF